MGGTRFLSPSQMQILGNCQHSSFAEQGILSDLLLLWWDIAIVGVGSLVYITSGIQGICADLNSAGWIHPLDREIRQRSGSTMDTTSSKQLIVLWVPCCLFGLYQLYQARSQVIHGKDTHTSFLNLITNCSSQLPGTTAYSTVRQRQHYVRKDKKENISLLKWEMAQMRSTVKHLRLYETQGMGVLTVQLSETRQRLEEVAIEAS